MHVLNSQWIVYLDHQLIVLNKPAGLLSVPGRGLEKQNSLAQQVQHIYPDACVVHRLDMATSGLLLMARGKNSHSILSKTFAQRNIQKTYLAWVAGCPKEIEHTIDLPLGADWPRRPRQKVDLLEGKPSQTHYRILQHAPDQNQSLALISPLTGRSHQIRLHMSAIGHPILGDTMYAPVEYAYAYPRLMLHAWQLRFSHPETGKWMHVEARPDFAISESVFNKGLNFCE